jgi:hypothetical protein
MELTYGLGKVEHDLGDVGPTLEIAASLELEEVSLGSQHHVPLEALAQAAQFRLSSVRSADGLSRSAIVLQRAEGTSERGRGDVRRRASADTSGSGQRCW